MMTMFKAERIGALVRKITPKLENKARTELASYLLDVHGDKPAFEYPILTFDDIVGSSYNTVGK